VFCGNKSSEFLDVSRWIFWIIGHFVLDCWISWMDYWTLRVGLVEPSDYLIHYAAKFGIHFERLTSSYTFIQSVTCRVEALTIRNHILNLAFYKRTVALGI